MKPALALTLLTAALALPFAALAQSAAPAPKRTILQHADAASTPAQETLLGLVEVPPGTSNPPHTHRGTEMGVVIEGQVRLEVEGQAPRVLNPGDSFLVARGVVHRSVPLSANGVKMINTWTVDKGADLMTPAPAK